MVRSPSWETRGTGKSLLGLRIADSWRKNFEVILLSSSKFCTRRALLQCLLFELRMPYRDLSEGELRLSLQERLQLSMENPSDGLILIVDEAQSLNLKLLEELRMLTNLARDGQPRVRLILIGTPRLDELLGHSRMESLNQDLPRDATSIRSPTRKLAAIFNTRWNWRSRLQHRLHRRCDSSHPSRGRWRSTIARPNRRPCTPSCSIDRTTPHRRIPSSSKLGRTSAAAFAMDGCPTHRCSECNRFGPLTWTKTAIPSNSNRWKHQPNMN